MTATCWSTLSKHVCQICGQEASYRCLHCAKPVFNRSKSGSLAASGGETGWKSGHVSLSTPCTSSKLEPCVEEHSATPQGSNTIQGQRRDKCALNFPNTKFKSEFAKQNPYLGSRKLADQFGIGKTQIQTILKNKGGDYRRVCQQWNFKSRKTFIQVLRCQSSCVGPVYNVEKLLHPGLRLYAPRRGKVNRRTIWSLPMAGLNLQSPRRACKYSYFTIVKLGWIQRSWQQFCRS